MSRAAEIAWAAGLFEGEGSIVIPNREPMYFQLTMASTDFDVLSRFQKVVAVGAIRITKLQPTNVKQVWTWRVGGLDAACLLEDFMPWLGSRRSERAREALLRYESQVA